MCGEGTRHAPVCGGERALKPCCLPIFCRAVAKKILTPAPKKQQQEEQKEEAFNRGSIEAPQSPQAIAQQAQAARQQGSLLPVIELPSAGILPSLMGKAMGSLVNMAIQAVGEQVSCRMRCVPELPPQPTYC